MDPAILIALLAAALSCWFSACAGALRTFSRSKLAELLEPRGQADRLEPFVRNGRRILLMAGATRSGLNLIVLGSTIWFFYENSSLGWPPLAIYAVSLALAAALVSVFSVAIPVALAHYHPERMLARSMPLLNAMLFVTTPLVRVLHVFDPLVRRITGAEMQPNGENELSDQVMTVVEDHGDGTGVDEDQKEMLEAVFEFKSTSAGEIMTPRTDVDGIEVGATLGQVRQAVIDMGHSRIPVFEESLDHIVGILYAKDLIRLIGADNGAPFKLRDLLREAMLVPETKPVSELLAEFKAQKVHIAIVLDEYGGTAGIVTIEDILEELVGEIEDEYEEAEQRPEILRRDDGAYEVDARVYVDELNDELRLTLPEDEDFDTVGGFVLSTLGHIPEVGESFEFENVRVIVTDAERTKVNRVRLEMIEPAMREGNGH